MLAAYQCTKATYGTEYLHSQLVDQGVRITASLVRMLPKKVNAAARIRVYTLGDAVEYFGAIFQGVFG
ncbi:hypothetical protein BCL69_101154 [Nitrosomonas communis]|uniref:Uncharacterized protein n=1 Tax=Nitrosomonas communis TaxID=44574 RepID=A0A0F7KFC6_9PROT|nr:hypothetical protein AAW31_10830 [Nitrosomonas communis]TYP91148.1 hypothetical protein BCL69_101154 [Nitrosomonas communis]